MGRRLFISFSGGETSAFMAQWLIANRLDRYDEVVVVFANTGQENEATLEFADRCDRHFGLGLIWVEGVMHEGQRKGASAKVVSFATASRDGLPFEQMIQKYGIPNQKYPHCTRELKLNPMTNYLRVIGWEVGSYDTAVGIRADEIDRMSVKAKANRIIYPLIADAPMTKPQINEWWSKQPFRLGLAGYQGNCRWCWKKSARKHMTLMIEDPCQFNFPERMEGMYAQIGVASGQPRTFFRGNRSTKDLRTEAASLPAGFVPAENDAAFDPSLDVGGACGESCEVHADEDQPHE
ncbi:phosphoadenosine phosphosulfate reductase domain-containing protein [Arenimonas alkanexedens]